MSTIAANTAPSPAHGPHSAPAARLRVQRMPADLWASDPTRRTALGAIGCVGPAHPPSSCGLPARTLLGDPVLDVWSGSTSVASGRTGHVHWRSDGRLLFGSLAFDEADAAASLEAVTHAAYADVFACLREAGLPALLRVWNYLPRINEEAPARGATLERYRQFNAGRQRAFLDAGAAAFDGAPVACALGTRAGPMCISFLAGAAPALAIENPRQVSAYRYPERYGPKSPSFSRAALLDAGDGEVALLVSGTSSIVGHETLHAGDVAAQTRETLANLQAVVAAANTRGTAGFALADLHCTIYVRHADEAQTVRALFDAAVGAGSTAARSATVVEADICRHDLRVEIEAHGFAPGEVRA